MKLSKRFKEDLKAFTSRLFLCIWVISIWYATCGLLVETFGFNIIGFHFLASGSIFIIVIVMALSVFFKLLLIAGDACDYMFNEPEENIDYLRSEIQNYCDTTINTIRITVKYDLNNLDRWEEKLIINLLRSLKDGIMLRYRVKKYPYLVMTKDFRLHLTYSDQDLEPIIIKHLTQREYLEERNITK